MVQFVGFSWASAEYSAVISLTAGLIIHRLTTRSHKCGSAKSVKRRAKIISKAVGIAVPRAMVRRLLRRIQSVAVLSLKRVRPWFRAHRNRLWQVFDFSTSASSWLSGGMAETVAAEVQRAACRQTPLDRLPKNLPCPVLAQQSIPQRGFKVSG